MGTIGSKQKRIVIEKATAVPDGQGGRTTTYATRAVLWAHERPLTGKEAIRAEQLAAVLQSVWEIWYRTDISVKDRIRFQGRIAQIESISDPTDERDELYLYCSEVQA